MTDAAAQAAMKRAIAIDEIAELEMQAADRITQEVQAAAPGSAPILEAGAAAWLVRANAYTQAALTELMRLRAIDLASAGAEMKAGRAACRQVARQYHQFAQEKLGVFYYEQFFRTALDGIDRSNIMPATIQIAQVILLISFLVAVYESFIRGGDVRMLGVAGVKYVGLGLVLLGYAAAFRDVNAMFNSFADFVANNTTGGTDIFSVWMTDLRDHFNQVGYQGLLDLIAGGLVG